MINTTKTPFVVAAACAFLLATQGIKANRILADKAQRQAAVTEAVERWSQNYLALSDSADRWKAAYRSESEVGDLLALLTVLNLTDYHLSASADGLMLNKIEPVAEGGMSIGLTRACLASTGVSGAAVEVSATDYHILFLGIRRLAERPDIQIGTISVRGDKPFPVAALGDLCVLLSKD